MKIIYLKERRLYKGWGIKKKGAGKNGNTHLVRGGCGPLPASLAIRGEKILLATARVHGR